MGDVFLSLKIKTKNQTLFDGNVKSISSFNEKGAFDIIPYHTHFVSIIKGNIAIVGQNNESKQIEAEKGIIWVKDNQVEIYVGL